MPLPNTQKNKAIVQDWSQLENMDDTTLKLRALTQREIGALAAMVTYLGWKTRYLNAPDQDDLDAFKAETEYDLTHELEICALVIACINDDVDVRQALANWFADAAQNNTTVINALAQAFNPDVPGGTVPPNIAAGDLMLHNSTCDNDTAWGNIRTGIIDRGMQRIQDVLEKIELTTDNQEMLADTIDIIPVLGVGLRAAGVGALIGWFDNVRAFLKDAFEAGDTVDKRDAMACDLFCIWQENCSLSFDQIRQYFWQNTIDNFPSYENAFTDIVALVIALGDPTELTGEFVVDCLLGAEYGFISFINDWFGVRLTAVQGDALIGDPSDDWMALCPDCPTFWSYEVDLLTSGDWGDAAIVHGTFVPGVGIVGSLEGDGTNLMQLHFSVSDWLGSTLTRVKLWANATAASSGSFRGMIYVEGGTPIFHDLGGDESGDYTLTDDAPPSTPEDIYLHLSNLPVSYGINTLTKYRLEGTGVSPFL